MSRGKKENILQPYDFNHKREYLIYLNACGKKLNKKESVLIGKDRFSTYEQWSEYFDRKPGEFFEVSQVLAEICYES